MSMWHTAADNHTHSHIVNTETREKQHTVLLLCLS